MLSATDCKSTFGVLAAANGVFSDKTIDFKFMLTEIGAVLTVVFSGAD